jgi:hypothetical protein
MRKNAYIAPAGGATSIPGVCRLTNEEIARPAKPRWYRPPSVRRHGRNDPRTLDKGRRARVVVFDRGKIAHQRRRAPSRQPVISHDFEKLLVLIRRSSGEAMSRNDGAQGYHRRLA